MAVVDRELKIRYDTITSEFLAEGVDLSRFFGNPSYFKIDGDGNRIELAGRHSTTVHFPITGYAGGAALARRLAVEVTRLVALAGATETRWIAPQNWHSTVFSHVHSSDPEVIAAAEARMDPRRIQQELRTTESYSLTFTRLLVRTNGGVIAVAHPSNGQLSALRRRLEAICPGAKSGELIHLTLGQLVSAPGHNELEALKAYVQSFAADNVILGQLNVNFLTYAEYQGPFLAMTIHEIYREPLQSRPRRP